MSRVAVTGAAGYVGGRLVRHLQTKGVEVRPLVRRPVEWMPGAVDLDLAHDPHAELVDALSDVTAVVHLAGATEVAAAADPDGSLARTTAATRRVAVAARDAGVECFVYLSTFHVYGAAIAGVPIVDEGLVPAPRHPYAIARLASEHLAASVLGDALVVLRLTNSVGAPLDRRVDRWTLVANELSAQAAAGGPLRLMSSGLQWRDFVDLGDACAAIGAAAQGRVPAGTYNLGSGRSRTVRELADLIADVAEDLGGSRPEVVAPQHEGPVPERVDVSVERLAAHLAPPSVPLESSIRELIELCTAEGPTTASEGRG